jgi:murein DD-endopeptidase MepM/ murein hydrolase activator NlpD
MTRGLKGALPIVAVAAVAAVIWLGSRGSLTLGPSAAELRADSVRSIEARTRRDTLRNNETLELLLRRGGLEGVAIREIIAAAPMIDPRRLRPGLPVEFLRDNDSTPATSILFKMAIDHHVRVERADSVSWRVTEIDLPWNTDTVVVRGAVATNLYDALHGAADSLFPGRSHDGLVFAIADVYRFRVDMSRELHKGDSVHAVVVRERGPESTTRVSRVLASRLHVAGRPIEAFHFKVESSRNPYYDGTGKSLATAFLRSPIEFARITSGFGSRYHPILRIRRAHEGVDYGAGTGTPVNSIADGTVIRSANTGDGYGNVVEVRHANGYITRYAHLSRFSTIGRRGNRVMQGDVIGYVGATGLATGPHLHFEIIVRGNQMSPSVALRNVDGTPLPDASRSAFDAAKVGLLALLGRAPGIVKPPTGTH